MSQLRGACIFGQSGGPTAVINSSTLGTIEAALESDSITRVLGAAHGIMGVLKDQLYDMGLEDPAELALLRHTPAAALGSCRYKLADPEEDATEYHKILDVFRKYNVRYFFYNGGNDSMDTCSKISRYLRSVSYECRVIGIPKTIDNDLFGTDHCPGYGSAAKFIATTCMEVYQDAHVYDTGMVTIIEIMGRHAGWLTAASTLATYAGYGPDLIYLPELPFDLEEFLDSVNAVYSRKGKCMVAVSEGIRDKMGCFISEYGTAGKERDAFGHVQLGGLASILAGMVKSHLKSAKVRGIELSLLQRCAAHMASQTDIDEAYAVGYTAVEAAVAGATDQMVALDREHQSKLYLCRPRLVALEEVANLEKKIPREWINAQGNGLEQKMVDYALPLIHGEPNPPKNGALPRFARLKKILTTDIQP